MITHLILKPVTILSLLSISLGACDHASPLDPGADSDLTLSQKKQQKALPFHGSTVGRLIGQSFPAPEGRCPPQRPILAEYEEPGMRLIWGASPWLAGSACSSIPTILPPSAAARASTGSRQQTGIGWT